MRKLAPGKEGGVALTRSITDGTLQVRKKTHPADREDAESKIPEVEFHRDHPLIPSLIWSQDYKVLNIYHENYDTLKATVMYSTFCNGGTLNRMCEIYSAPQYADRHLPETALWRMLDQRVQTLLYLHNSEGGITQLDNHLNNCFLHYAEGAKLPDFYTGDLGHVKAIDPVIWQETTANASAHLKFRKVKDTEDQSTRPFTHEDKERLCEDVKNVWIGLFSLMYRVDVSEDDPSLDLRDESRERQDWSAELYDCEERLEVISQFFDPGQATHYNDLEALSVEISRMAEHTADSDPDADLTFLLQGMDLACYEEDFDEDFDGDNMYYALLGEYREAHLNPDKPAIFDSRVALLQLAKRWPEPWRIARIDENTGRVIGVEKMTFNLSIPKLSMFCNPSQGDDPRTRHVAQSTSYKIGLEKLLVAAAEADTTTHRIQEDFSIMAFPRGPNDDPDEDEIFGLDAKWTAERLAGPNVLQGVNAKREGIEVPVTNYLQHQISPRVYGSVGNPIIIDDSDPIVIDDDSDDDLMEIDG